GPDHGHRMNADSQWHYENFEPTGSAIGYRITRKLDEVRSPFQHIEIFETTDWGNLMLIDGAVMLTSRDNFLYHEMMSHPALFTPTSRGSALARRSCTSRSCATRKSTRVGSSCSMTSSATGRTRSRAASTA